MSDARGHETGGILGMEMASRDDSPIISPDDPRLIGMDEGEVAGADQIAGLLSATPDERLDSLVAMLDFVEEARSTLRNTTTEG